MAKEKEKRFRRKGKKVDQPNAKIKKKGRKVTQTKAIAPASPAPAEATALDRERNSNEGSSQGKEREIQKTKHLSGFIFMCNPNTKLECYQYRVFGLPMGQKDLVEKIKPGSKLFLYDFQLKLLYGIYEATSVGKLNLEPAAFKGKFPAQVKFKIFKECLPMPENTLRHVITENYTGSKFKQQLSGKQVKKLLSSFRPLTASSIQPVPQAMVDVPPARARPPSSTQNKFKHIPYIPQSVNHQTAPRANYLQPGYNRTSAYVERVPPILDHQSISGTSNYYGANSQWPSTQGVAHAYSRYMPGSSHNQVTHSARQYLQMPLQGQNNTSAYNSNPIAPAQYNSSAAQPQASPYHPLPLHRSSLYQDNAAQAQYASSAGLQPHAPTQSLYASAIMQPQIPGHYHQLPLQREMVYQDNVSAYNSYPANSAQYTSAATESLAPPGVSLGSASIPSYYSYDGANHLSR